MRRRGQIFEILNFATRYYSLRNKKILGGETTTQLTGAACVALTALGWGLNWPATKVLIATFPPLTARGVSGLAASVIYFP